MQIVDANVLLYAVNPSSPHHERAHAWLVNALSGLEAVGLAWAALLTFIRIGTSRGAFPRPLTVEEACGYVERWLAQPNAVVVGPTTRHLAVLRSLLEDTGSGGNLVSDAHLAALALEHGAEIVSFDRDFQRFAGLRSFVP